jgi:hypothetical protein
MPIDRGLIDRQLQDLGEDSHWWDVRELRDLPSVLSADERILAIAHGKIARVRWLRRPWLIVVTDQRLVCVRSGRGTTWRQLEVPAHHITRVSLRIGPMRGRVLVTAGDRKYRFLVGRPEAHRLLSAISLVNTAANRTVGRFGATRMVRQVIDHMLALPAVALGPEAQRGLPPGSTDTARLTERLEAMEAQLEALQQHVEFLEQLLRDRQAGAAPGVEPGQLSAGER